MISFERWCDSAQLELRLQHGIEADPDFFGDESKDGYSYGDAWQHFTGGWHAADYARIVAKRVALIEQAQLEAERE